MFLAMEKRRQQVLKYAAETFDKFQIKQEAPNQWFCSSPKTNASSFRVILAPGLVIVAGDVGDLILNPHDYQVDQWLHHAIDDLDYVLGKTAPALEKKEFVSEAVKEWVNNPGSFFDLEDQDDKQDLEDLRDWVKNWWDESEQAFYQYYFEERDDLIDLPRFSDWTHNLLWCYHGLRWFVETLGPELKVKWT